MFACSVLQSLCESYGNWGLKLNTMRSLQVHCRQMERGVYRRVVVCGKTEQTVRDLRLAIEEGRQKNGVKCLDRYLPLPRSSLQPALFLIGRRNNLKNKAYIISFPRTRLECDL